MYLPPHFAEADEREVEAILDAAPLAALVVATEAGLVANHIPLLREGRERLLGHIALANDLHRIAPDGCAVLAIFRGEDAYVSPNWYPTKPRHHRHVPTWNYQAVHVSGTLHFSHDEKAKRAIVGRLTRRFESETNGEAAWRMADAPAGYMAQMLAAIVAVEIRVTGIIAKSKLSQNRDAEDFAAVTEALGSRGRQRLSGRMQRMTRGEA